MDVLELYYVVPSCTGLYHVTVYKVLSTESVHRGIGIARSKKMVNSLGPWTKKRRFSGKIQYKESRGSYCYTEFKEDFLKELRLWKNRSAGPLDFTVDMFYTYEQAREELDKCEKEGKKPPMFYRIIPVKRKKSKERQKTLSEV